MKKQMYIFGLAGMLILVGITPAFAGSSVPEIEALKHQIQQIIQENQNLKNRVSQLEKGRQGAVEPAVTDEHIEAQVSKILRHKEKEQLQKNMSSKK